MLKKVDVTRFITIITAVVCSFFLLITAANVIPWYTQDEPMQIMKNDEPFAPGQPQLVDVHRTALVGFEGRVTRELVKIHSDGAEEEVYKLDKLVSIDRGTKNVQIYYTLPTILECPQITGNTYKWRGSMVYKPFGLLEKTYFFTTDTFQLEVAWDGG